MKSLQAAMATFKDQLEDGELIMAYQGLMAFFRELRTHFEKNHPNYAVPGNIYYGYLDMTYFAVIPPTLKSHKLKIAIVFDYEHFRFEVWLSGSNRKVQAEVWQQLQDDKVLPYRLANDPKTMDYILAAILVEDPDFSDLEMLTAEIETGTSKFIHKVEQMLERL